METIVPDNQKQEAFAALAQYLSDTIPPVHAADVVNVLIQQPPQQMASAIIRWTSSQYRANERNASIADYLFHAVSKLDYLSQLQLVPEKSLTHHLEGVQRLLLEYCPEEDRQCLRESFSHVRSTDAAIAAPVRLAGGRAKADAADAGIRGNTVPAAPRERRLAILRGRLQSVVRQPILPAGYESVEDPVPRLIASAISETRTSDELQSLQQNLQILGIASGMDQIFRKLSQSLPGWLIATTGTDVVQSHNPALEAMRQVMNLTEDRWEAYKRFQDLVQAAIEQFNAGSLARAATMFDLALNLGTAENLNQDAVMGIRKTAHESLDWNRLRALSKERDKHALLLKVLHFFSVFSVENLLECLQKEEKRDRRRLFLDLLEIHGDAARKMAVERLKALLAVTNVAADWHFARNLVCILSQIPRPVDVPVKTELDLVAPLLRLSLPVPLVREAIRYVGQNKSSESEELLIQTVDRLENAAIESAPSGRDLFQRLSLLDRAIFALTHIGTSRAYERVIRHGMSRQDKLGDTGSRLAYLFGQDLSAEKPLLDSLIQFLKSKLPRRVLGVMIQKNEQLLYHIVRALSSTPSPIVRQAFEDIVLQYPETKYAQAAAIALKEFGAAEAYGHRAGSLLSGDLNLFGLPDLLQQLNQRRATGILTLKDAKGNAAGTFTLVAGHMQNCLVGRLEGVEAAYHLLEKPIAGTFFFQGQKDSDDGERPDSAELKDLKAILSEGMRRYDALQRARSIVPDFAQLRHSGTRPIPQEEEDSAIAPLIWEKTAAGASPEECEAVCSADSYRIRALLARWTEAGILTVE